MSVFHNSLIGYVVGDCLGVPVKSSKRKDLFKNPVVNMLGDGNFDVEAGVWSDDTALTLATMDSIIRMNKINCDNLAKKYCDWINKGTYTATGYVFDINTTTRFALMKFWESKKNAVACGLSDNQCNDNNSLTRMMPIAFYLVKNDYLNVLKEVNEVSSITHSNSVVRLGCYLYVEYMITLIKYISSGRSVSYSKKKAYKRIKELELYDYFSEDTISKYKRILDESLLKENLSNINSSSNIVDTLESILWIINNTNSFEEALIGAVNLGGCTDTITALTGSIAGILYGIDKIPDRWKDAIVNMDYLERLSIKYEETLYGRGNVRGV